MRFKLGLFFAYTFLCVLGSPENQPEPVHINKCCEENELMIDNRCTTINDTHMTLWQPLFTNEQGRTNLQVKYRFVIGDPNCGSTQQWTVLHYQKSTDQLHLLPSGVLRHYVHHHTPSDDIEEPDENTFHHDYNPGEYCLDKVRSK